MAQVNITRLDPQVGKRDFFNRPTVAQICKNRERIEARDDLIARIDALTPEQALVIQLGEVGLIPDKFYIDREGKPDYATRTRAARKFMKHGDVVDLADVDLSSLERRFRENRAMHVAFREDAFNEVEEGKALCGYTFRPVVDDKGRVVNGSERVVRHVPLTECVDAALMLHYWYHSTASVDVDAVEFFRWADIQAPFRRLRRDGMMINVRVPSRTPGKPRYAVQLENVPITDNLYGRLLAFGVKSSHTCPTRNFSRGINFENDNTRFERMYFDSHDIFAYLATMIHFHRKDNPKYHAMRRNCPFALPTEQTVQFDQRLRHQVVIQAHNGNGEVKLYPLNEAEREILHWGRVQKQGHDATFFARPQKPIARYQL